MVLHGNQMHYVVIRCYDMIITKYYVLLLVNYVSSTCYLNVILEAYAIPPTPDSTRNMGRQNQAVNLSCALKYVSGETEFAG